MKQLVSKNIDGSKYEFQQFGASHSLKVLTKLTKICGESITLAMTATKGSGNFFDREFDSDVLGKAVRSLVDKLDEDQVIDLIEELTARHVLCDGKQFVFDAHYEGRLDHLFKVLGAALEVQYGNFFGALTKSDKLPGIRNTPPPSPAT